MPGVGRSKRQKQAGSDKSWAGGVLCEGNASPERLPQRPAVPPLDRAVGAGEASQSIIKDS